MRHHTYPVILLGGWLLMVPPSETKVVNGSIETKADTAAPIARWLQDSAYDTARDCQAAFAGLADRVIPDMMLPVYVASRCVPAEAVYPPKHPAKK
jgi:hypothetical protein